MEMCGLAQKLEWLGHAANAQSANPHGGWSVSGIRACGETRDPRERAEPQRAVAIAECRNHFASRKTVGNREVFELATLGFEPIDTARRACVEVAGPVVGQAPDRPAAQPVGHRVRGEAGTFGRGIVRAVQAGASRTDPQPAARIDVKCGHPDGCVTVSNLDVREAAVPMPGQATARYKPHGPRTVLGEHWTTKGHQRRIGLRILMKAAGRTLPAHDAAVGPEVRSHPDVATGILERRSDAGDGQSVRDRIDGLRPGASELRHAVDSGNRSNPAGVPTQKSPVWSSSTS